MITKNQLKAFLNQKAGSLVNFFPGIFHENIDKNYCYQNIVKDCERFFFLKFMIQLLYNSFMVDGYNFKYLEKKKIPSV